MTLFKTTMDLPGVQGGEIATSAKPAPSKCTNFSLNNVASEARPVGTK